MTRGPGGHRRGPGRGARRRSPAGRRGGRAARRARPPGCRLSIRAKNGSSVVLKTPPARTTSTGGRVIAVRRARAIAIVASSSARRSTIERATGSPSPAAAEHDRRELADAGVGDTTVVERPRHRRRSAEAEVGRDERARATSAGRVRPRARTAAARPGHPDRCPAAPVARDVAHPVEPRRSAVGRDRRAVDPLAADEGDPPPLARPGPQRADAVVDDDVSLAEPGAREGPLEHPNVGGEVGPGDRVDADRRDRSSRGIEPGLPRRPPRRVRRAGRSRPRARPPGATSSGRGRRASSLPVGRDQRDVRLRVAAVDGENRGRQSGMLRRQAGRARRPRRTSRRARGAPRRSPAAPPRVWSGHVCWSTTAPSP